MSPVSPKPWSIHRTGSHIGIKDAKGKFVFRKVVNSLTIDQYNRLEADLEHVVICVNHWQQQGEGLVKK